LVISLYRNTCTINRTFKDFFIFFLKTSCAPRTESIQCRRSKKSGSPQGSCGEFASRIYFFFLQGEQIQNCLARRDGDAMFRPPALRARSRFNVGEAKRVDHHKAPAENLRRGYICSFCKESKYRIVSRGETATQCLDLLRSAHGVDSM